MYNPAIRRLDIPPRIRLLPVDERGFPVPKFVPWLDGKPDFRGVSVGYLRKAMARRLCWLCGQLLGRHMAFVIGPMCAVNRINSEPPSHLDCARFAVKACPFLTQPRRMRNEYNVPEAAEETPGFGILRNPGVAVIWVTMHHAVEQARAGGKGYLFHLGNPTLLEWYAHGRTATREEIMASINAGLPALFELAKQDGPEAEEELRELVERAMELVPAV